MLVLVVHTDATTLRRTNELLSKEGYVVAEATSFESAKEFLCAAVPDLLVADVRLDAYNGLHLAVRSSQDHPHLPVIVTHAYEDVVLEAEAKRLHAQFVVNPLENPEFLARVKSALSAGGNPQQAVRRWPRKRSSGEIMARIADADARVIDMSYGGFRLELCSDVPPPQIAFEVTLLEAGLTLLAAPVWSGHSRDQQPWCGAELVDIESPDMSRWRAFVDAVQ